MQSMVDEQFVSFTEGQRAKIMASLFTEMVVLRQNVKNNGFFFIYITFILFCSENLAKSIVEVSVERLCEFGSWSRLMMVLPA